MNIPANLLSASWGAAGFVLFAAALLWAVRLAPWRRLQAPGQFNLWLGANIALMLVWSMKAGVQPGLNLHLLGATALTLMFGPALALLGLTMVLVAVTFNSNGAWPLLGLSGIVSVVVPVLVADGMRRLVVRWLPANFFVFVFVGAFFGAAVSVLAAGVAATTVFAIAQAYPTTQLLSEYLLYFVLLGFAEAWLNGAVITLMVVYAPHWVGSFDDKRYLLGK